MSSSSSKSSQARLRDALTSGGPSTKDKGPPVADGVLSVTPDTAEAIEWRSRKSVVDGIASTSAFLDDDDEGGCRRCRSAAAAAPARPLYSPPCWPPLLPSASHTRMPCAKFARGCRPPDQRAVRQVHLEGGQVWRGGRQARRGWRSTPTCRFWPPRGFRTLASAGEPENEERAVPLEVKAQSPSPPQSTASKHGR